MYIIEPFNMIICIFGKKNATYSKVFTLKSITAPDNDCQVLNY